MIIQIRGTSGSGKTHLVKRLMEKYASCEPFYHEEDYEETLLGRDLKPKAKPHGYIGVHPRFGTDSLLIEGRYDIATGGADGLTSRFGWKYPFELARKGHEEGRDVIFEGLILSHERQNTADMVRKYDLPFLAIFLTTPLEVCLASVNSRRRLRNPAAEDVNPKNTEAKYRDNLKSKTYIESQGVKTALLSREEAFERVCQELKL